VSATAALEIRLFGAAQFLVDGLVVDDTRWTRRKAKSLVKILALQKGHQMHREQLIDLLWPEMDGEAGLNSFHKTIHAARRALEPMLETGANSRFLQIQNQMVVLQADGLLLVDIEGFEEAALASLASRNMAKLLEASSLYPADLLIEDRFEDWATVRREQLGALRQRVLDELARVQEDKGERTAALSSLETLVQLAPVNEDAQRRLIRLHLALGQRHLALSQYQSCVAALAKELGTEPEAATLQLLEQIKAGVAREGMHLDQAKRGVKYGVLAVLFALLGLAAYWGWVSTKSRDIDSIAVFPLSAVGEMDSSAYIGDGITENLIHRLSQLPKLRVMARSTVFTYRDKKTDPRAAAKEMRVSAVITGTIAQLGDEVEVTAELVDVADGARLWGDRLRVPKKDLSVIPSRLIPPILGALRQKVKLEKAATENSAAYRSYLLGLFFLNQRTRSGFEKAVRSFESATLDDPGFAAAYAGLANAYGLEAFSEKSPLLAVDMARKAARKALQLDPELAEAHTALAMIAALYDWDWAMAEQEFRLAISLNPGYATAHHWYGVHLAAMGKFAAAREQLAQASALDPLSPIIRLNSGYPDYYERQYEAATIAYQQALELNPSFFAAHEELATAYQLQGNQKATIERLVLALSGEGEYGLAGAIEKMYARSGYQAALEVWLDRLLQRRREQYVSPMTVARVRIGLGQKSEALTELEKGFAEKSAALAYLNVDPLYDLLRGELRFQSLLQKIGLPSRK
jgi:DNA-binding SARP family transcriptional activator/TolB-like protein/Flp pilus assembly protein TadD